MAYSQRKDYSWKYLPEDKRSIAFSIVEFLDSISGRDKVKLLFFISSFLINFY